MTQEKFLLWKMTIDSNTMRTTIHIQLRQRATTIPTLKTYNLYKYSYSKKFNQLIQ